MNLLTLVTEPAKPEKEIILLTFTTRRGGRRASVVALLTAPVLALALAACAPGAETPPDRVDSGGGSDSANATFTQWQLDFAECMREHGVDMEDPSGSGTTSTKVQTTDEDRMEQAKATCITKLGDPPAMTQEERDASNAQFMEWSNGLANCYRQKGYEMPDPKAGEPLQIPQDAPDDVRAECGGSVQSGVSQ